MGHVPPQVVRGIDACMTVAHYVVTRMNAVNAGRRPFPNGQPGREAGPQRQGSHPEIARLPKDGAVVDPHRWRKAPMKYSPLVLACALFAVTACEDAGPPTGPASAPPPLWAYAQHATLANTATVSLCMRRGIIGDTWVSGDDTGRR